MSIKDAVLCLILSINFLFRCSSCLLSFQVCGVMVSASEDSTPSVIYHCVLRGLERLLLSEQLSRVDGEALVKLSVDRVNMPSPHRAMAALGLMLTCMYTGKRDWKAGFYLLTKCPILIQPQFFNIISFKHDCF